MCNITFELDKRQDFKFNTIKLLYFNDLINYFKIHYITLIYRL